MFRPTHKDVKIYIFNSLDPHCVIWNGLIYGA